MPDRAPYYLLPHPALPNAGGLAIAVGVHRSAAGLTLNYRISGAAQAISLPAQAAAGPADELWRHTCCEAFIAGESGYHEFNFSPSGAWAVYRFTAIRQRDAAYRLPAAPIVHCLADAGGFTLTADIPAALFPPGTERRLGLTAVIERADGSLAYWALRHDGPQPDFHRPATFLIPLDIA